MSSSSPSPNSPIPGAPPPPPDLSGASPPPARSAPPPQSNSSPPPANISPPRPPPTASPPPAASPPPPTLSPPPTPPPPTASPPRRSPPPSIPFGPPISPPPPATSPPPIPETPAPELPKNPPPPPTSTQPESSPPPPSTTPPQNSPPPPAPRTPESSPPPPQSTTPPQNSPPPPAPRTPESSPPPPPSTTPPQNSPPPPAPRTPESSPPPPPSSTPPKNSAPPPAPRTPESSPPPPPPNSEPPPIPPASPPSFDPPQVVSPPPVLLTSPPPPSTVPPPSSPPPLPFAPPANQNNNSTGNTRNNLQSPSEGIGTVGTVAIALVLSILFLGVFGTAACCVWRRKKRATGQNGGHILPTTSDTSPESGSNMSKVQTSASSNGTGSGIGIVHSPNESSGFGNSRSWFTYEELVEATDGFSDQNLLGEGGFGSVYKGQLADGREVAVKQLKIGGRQGEREFKSEVEIISRIHHRHLVSLVGYCISENRRLLVYEYVPNNTLHFHLQGRGRPVMNWATRAKIAVGAARGMAYLHEDCHPRVIHRDIKSSNILLDDNFEARVSDFGLAKLAMDADSHITTRVMGTFGYMAPEYASTGKLTEKSDVYSFGVVLLELISGRKPVDTSQPLGEESLVEWARPLLSHALETQEFEGLVDPRLEDNYVDSEMFRMIEAAAACVRHSAAKRPKMGNIVRAFDSVDLSNGIKVGDSEVFNTAQQSEEIGLFQRMAFGSRDYSTDFFSQNSWSSEGNQVNSSYESALQSFSNRTN